MEHLTIEQLKEKNPRQGVLGKHVWVYDVKKEIFIAAIIDGVFRVGGGTELAAIWAPFQFDKPKGAILPFFLERDYGATWLAFETLPT